MVRDLLLLNQLQACDFIGLLIAALVLNRKYWGIAHSDKAEVGKRYLSESGTLGSALVNKLRTSGEKVF